MERKQKNKKKKKTIIKKTNITLRHGYFRRLSDEKIKLNDKIANLCWQ